MSNDNKTLADAQPGGRVRLGDQAERARFEAWVSGKDIGIDRWKNGAYMSRYVQEKWEIWQAALSAQPSPGGQGDMRRQWLEVRGLAAAIVKNLQAFADSPHKGAWCGALDDSLSFAETIEKDADAAYAAYLAARQPVGESDACLLPQIATERMLDAGWPCGEMIDRTFDRQGAYADLVAAAPASAGQPVGEVSVKKEDANNYCLILRALGMEEEGDPVAEVQALIEARDRQPVGQEPIGRVFYVDRILSIEWRDGMKPLEGAMLYAAPPTQAVDLGDFKALYRAYVRLLESGRDRIRDLGGTCDPVDVMEANDVDLQAARRVIDSQAVGK